MAKRFAALAAAVLFGMTVIGDVAAERPDELSPTRGLRPAGQSGNYLYDTLLRGSSVYARGGVDTTVWGNAVVGVNGGPVAVLGGVWDFESGSGRGIDNTQGWTSEDLTDLEASLGGQVPARRVTSDSFGPNDTDATMTDDGSTASVWFGALDAESQPGCWPGGQGYSNSWGVNMSKEFVWGGNGDVTVSMDYFTDSETQFDYTYVYVINSDGARGMPINTSAETGRQEDGLAWSGAVEENTAMGSPSEPNRELMNVDSSRFSGAINGPAFSVLINFDSDPLYSDGLDSFAGFLDTYGPLGVDDISVQGVSLNDVSDFEGGDDGWTFFIDPAIGAHLKVRNLNDPEIDPVGDVCACPLSENVLIATDLDGAFPHPKKQNESMKSAAAYTADNPSEERFVRFDIWEDLPSTNGIGFRIAMDYYPWTCPVTNVTGWTIEPLDQGGGFAFDTTFGGPICGGFLIDNTVGMPSAPDSIKIVLEVLGDCDDFGTVGCTGPFQGNQSPYWDNVQLVSVGSGGTTPVLGADVIFQDVFPSTNTLLPLSTADIHSYNDGNRQDMDETNANMGDSAVVVAGNEPLTEVYFNFRVYPGPGTNTNHSWFGEFQTGPIAPTWARARMDTAEVGGGSQVILGSYSTYLWPNGQENMASAFPNSSPLKIIEDGVLSPGTTVEYFFTANFSFTPGIRDFLPDTTDGNYFEFEVLPGYFEVPAAGGEGTDILAPCLLYVDAFNAGAQVPIEDKALRELLGTVTDVDNRVQDNWDRYDYIAASGNTPGPLAREANGDNGMTGYQSMIYNTIVYNTGFFAQEGLRNGDAALLANFLVSDDFNRPSISKGLWLSGNSMGRILSRPGRARSNTLLANFCKASLDCNIYREIGCTQSVNGDSSLCVRLDGTVGADFAQSMPYAVRGNGCPSILEFDVLNLADGTPNLQYVDQDNGGVVTQYASITNDQFATTGKYGVVLDGFSVHYLRTVPDAWTGSNCLVDSSGVLTRASDVFGFLQVAPTGCDPDPLFTGVEADPSSNPIAFTRLFQNSPNPFNPTTTVRYQLHDQAFVKLMIYDVSGKLVRTLVEDVQVTGKYSIAWDGSTDTGREVSSGVYWARMSTSLGFQASTKMVVLK